MEHENHIGERTGVKDADRTPTTEPSHGMVAPRALPSVTAEVVGFEGGDGGAAANLHPPDGADVETTDAPPAKAGAAVAPPVPVPQVPAAAPAAPAPAAQRARVESQELEAVKKKKAPPGRGPHKNNVRKLRIERMMSKAELARRANLSVLTIDRVEKGFGCRMDSKRKILEALGLNLADRVRVFGEEE